MNLVRPIPREDARDYDVTMQEWDVIIIGGGAAGLFCAIEAGKRGRRALVIEHSERVGKKIAISGGGRCNFTNTRTAPENFVSANPHFCKSALARYSPADFIALVEKHRIAYHEKKLGQLFCDGGSRQIIDMLLAECHDAGVELRCACEVFTVGQSAAEDGTAHRFSLQTSQGIFKSTALVIATGGLSIGPLGATDFGYRIARQFGLKIEATRPGLVPLTLAPGSLLHKHLTPLSGVSIDSQVTGAKPPNRSAPKPEFRENILLTHRGLSGPAILQISNYWQPGESVSIDVLPDQNLNEILASAIADTPEMELVNLLSKYLPRRFVLAWCELFVQSRALKKYNTRELQEIARYIHSLEIRPAGTEGFRKAEVTAGGVSTAELSSQTMEAMRIPGLYFIGEVVDVTGQLGGFNFQWAWASAFAAGRSV